MRKKINLLLIILIVVLSVCQLGVFGQTGNAENEPLEYFDFSIDGAISGPTATNKYYSWQGENGMLRPTGTNEDKIEFVFNEEYEALQINFNGDMVTNGSCLWLSLREAFEVSEGKSYYIVFKYKYLGDTEGGFLSPTQLLTGYSSVNNWSPANSGGRVLKSLTAAGMPTIQDGEWLLSFARISWTDKMTSIEYDGEKTNIKVIRTSLEDKISNGSVVLKSIALFEDHAGLGTMDKITEDVVKDLRTTPPVMFSMKKNFTSGEEVKYTLDDENAESVTFYENVDGEWKAMEGTPQEDGEYRIEVKLKDGYWFDRAWLGTSEDVANGILVYEFTIGEDVSETPEPTDEKPKETQKPDSTPKDEDGKGGNTGIIIGVVIGLVVIAAVVVVIIVRKKK
jgi:hypothetical protein